MRALALAIPLLLVSCKSIEPLVISGESMAILGDQFIETANLMDQALTDKQITVEQYQKWASFGTHFQEIYPLAIDIWHTARNVNDDVLQKQMGKLIADLAVTLAGFYTDIKSIVGKGPR